MYFLGRFIDHRIQHSYQQLWNLPLLAFDR